MESIWHRWLTLRGTALLSIVHAFSLPTFLANKQSSSTTRSNLRSTKSIKRNLSFSKLKTKQNKSNLQVRRKKKLSPKERHISYLYLFYKLRQPKKGYLLIYLLTCGMNLVRIYFYSNPVIFFCQNTPISKESFFQRIWKYAFIDYSQLFKTGLMALKFKKTSVLDLYIHWE